MKTSIAVIYQPELLKDNDIAHDVIQGITSEQVNVVAFTVANALASLNELDQFDGLVFGTLSGEFFSSGEMDAFILATVEKSESGSWRDKIASAFPSSLSLTAETMPFMLRLSIFCARHNMIWVEDGAFHDPDMPACEYETPSPGFEYGQRIARVTKQWMPAD
ncbi:hypothetical protein [Alteromonas sp. CYL-A6]|uniref:hypothetical protein n=1 Tax=Alteromonas nitratireducens TaxID=3390813 RepID=UPI0034B9F5C2